MGALVLTWRHMKQIFSPLNLNPMQLFLQPNPHSLSPHPSGPLVAPTLCLFSSALGHTSSNRDRVCGSLVTWLNLRLLRIHLLGCRLPKPKGRPSTLISWSADILKIGMRTGSVHGIAWRQWHKRWLNSCPVQKIIDVVIDISFAQQMAVCSVLVF